MVIGLSMLLKGIGIIILAASPYSEIESRWAIRPSAGMHLVLGSECHSTVPVTPATAAQGGISFALGDVPVLCRLFLIGQLPQNWRWAAKVQLLGRLKSVVILWSNIYL